MDGILSAYLRAQRFVRQSENPYNLTGTLYAYPGAHPLGHQSDYLSI